jgi:urea transporter/murein DD-endopeptidase MepM/ murein hydrolase activator NlpD
MKRFGWFGQSLFNSYAQVFFSNNKWFGIILLVITFMDFFVGLYGLLAVLSALFTGHLIGLYEQNIRQGYYGFNALLAGIGLGIYFEPGLLLLILVLISGVLTVFISVTMEGVLGKYGLPYLSIPFILIFWMLRLATRQFEELGLSERGVYILNDLYILGGKNLVDMYEWWNWLPMHISIKSYLLSLGAILFQTNVFSGVLAAVGLLLYSRIGFSLSLLGFYIAYVFYLLLGVPFSEISFSYIGFNYILTAIALGGYFIIPSRSSYLSQFIIIPVVAILGISLQQIFNLLYLPIHSFPFNLATLTFLYALKFRVDNRIGLSTIFWQQNSPERNLYSFSNFQERFGKDSPIPIYLPFFGEWTVTQGHNGIYTHKDDWRHAWDFEIKDEEGKTYKNGGDFPLDYYCFDKNILSPADGTVEEVVNNLPDNLIGVKNLEKNWGNTVIIKHADFLYSKLSHLKQDSIVPKIGDKVKKGEVLGKCGNSGNSPYPHLHFQLQATPFIGSKTIDYPISDVWIRHNGIDRLLSAANPPLDAITSSLIPEASLKRAFSFVVGNQIHFETEDGKIHSWEIKRDYFMNKYLECNQTGSKAYFKLDEAMLHFTHFEGDRKSLLYLFYLAAFKVSFGFSNDLQLKDSFPVHMVFHVKKIFLQDFIAPFYQYLKGEFTLTYPKRNKGFSSKPILLKGEIKKKSWGKTLEVSEFEFLIDQGGIRTFRFKNNNTQISSKCITPD